MTRLAALSVVLAATLVPSDGGGPTAPVPEEGPVLPVVGDASFAGLYAGNTFAGGGAGSPINDASATIAYAQVTESATIHDVNVTVSLDHTWVADLTIRLTSPWGTEVVLSAHNGYDGDGYAGTVFDDEAGVSITAGSAPFTGSYQPEDPLSSFDGEDQQGTWILTIVDGAWGDEGVLNSWALDIESDAAPSGGTQSAGQTLVIGDVDTGVVDEGGSFATAVADCRNSADNHGKFVSCVTQLANGWVKLGLINGQEKGAITSAAAKAKGS